MATRARATKPVSVELRSYQVGFGDCFLLTFVYSETDRRHVLIDFGTTELPARGRPPKQAKAAEHMKAIAELIREECGGEKGRLTAVVATHRHADHISGFGTEAKTGQSGKIISALRPKLVIQPWTEDPKARADATRATADSLRSRKSFVAGLSAMNAVAQSVVDMTERRPAWMSTVLTKELRFLGLDNIKNQSAVRNLIEMGRARDSKAIFARHGTRIALGSLLPGVKVQVLGPPDLQQSEKIRKQRSVDPDQFWHLLAGPAARTNGSPLAAGLPAPDAPRQHAQIPPEARWFRDRLQKMRGQQLLEIVRSLDDQMNNTSLILLFEVGGKKLLFPGDAQIENWSYALEDAPNSATTREQLKDVDLYKVGHHGSLNATPKQLLWANFKKRGPTEGKRLKAVLSTLPGKHGKTANQTEVPRKPLLNALERDTDLMSTDDFKFGAKPEMFRVITLDV